MPKFPIKAAGWLAFGSLAALSGFLTEGQYFTPRQQNFPCQGRRSCPPLAAGSSGGPDRTHGPNGTSDYRSARRAGHNERTVEAGSTQGSASGAEGQLHLIERHDLALRQRDQHERAA